jgi:hypothetical protein
VNLQVFEWQVEPPTDCSIVTVEPSVKFQNGRSEH